MLPGAAGARRPPAVIPPTTTSRPPGQRAVSKKLGKREFAEAIAPLRVRLVNAQYRLRESRSSLIVLLAGRDRMGGEQVIDRLAEWMDSRYLDTWFTGQDTDEARLRPEFWRFWRAMPGHGRTGLFMGAWISDTMNRLAADELDAESYTGRIRQYVEFDRLLRDDGHPVLKIWLDMPRAKMKQRLKLAREDADGARRYIEPIDEVIVEHYDKLTPVVQQLLSDSGQVVEWTTVDGEDKRRRDLTIAECLAATLESHLESAPRPQPVRLPACEIEDHLSQVDLTRQLAYETYKQRLKEEQRRLHQLSLLARDQQLGVVMAFEGWDAAGKGGAIRRLTRAISFRDVKVIPIGAPSDEELAHHYLWRFWRWLPRDGQIRIFDRSWYGRVLVERVEQFATQSAWKRAYAEINDFESQLTDHGNLVLKFWLHIDPDEQLRRFKAREQTDYKKYKITADDYRNREQWEAYEAAVNEMVSRTSLKNAPWHLIAANDKRWARVRVIETVNDALEQALEKL